MKLTLLVATFAVITGFASLPAHAAVSQSTAKNALQKIVDTVLPTQTTELENIDPLYDANIEPEDINPEANDFPTNTEDAIAAPPEEIIARATAAVANENGFGVTPETSTFPPASDIPEEAPPSDEDPSANDVGFPPFQSWDELFQHLKDSGVPTGMVDS